MIQKLFLFTLILTCTVSKGFAKGSVLAPLISQAHEMIGLINEAKSCEVTMQKGSILFCTGIQLTPEDLSFLKGLDFLACKNFLKQAGNKVIEAKLGKRPPSVEEDVWKDFFSTTKLALIIYDQKTILFKQGAKRGDCLHETLHFYQRKRKGFSSLAPIKRQGRKVAFQEELERVIEVVEKLEKKGEKKAAMDLAKKMQPFIGLQREWINIGQWLDEKEIYQSFLDFSKELGLDERDEDIALANLLRLKDSLSWKLRERVVHLGNAALTKKYGTVSIPTKQQYAQLKSEKYYQENFQKGLLSRNAYENQVISVRKRKSFIAEKTAQNLMEKLLLRGQRREFSAMQATRPDDVHFSFVLKENFIQVKLEGEWVVVDFGAQKSILPMSIFKKLKDSDVSLLGNQVLNTVNGRGRPSPYIQIKKGLKLGKGPVVSGLMGSVSDLGLKGVKGIIGLDFFRLFNQGRWVVDFKAKTIGPLSSSLPLTGEALVKGGRGVFDALEYYCSTEPPVKIRLDSGSQVFGDLNNFSKKKIKKCFPEFTRFGVISPNSLIFSRKVDLNLGLPFMLERMNKLSFDLEIGVLNVEWGKS